MVKLLLVTLEVEAAHSRDGVEARPARHATLLYPLLDGTPVVTLQAVSDTGRACCPRFGQALEVKASDLDHIAPDWYFCELGGRPFQGYTHTCYLVPYHHPWLQQHVGDVDDEAAVQALEAVGFHHIVPVDALDVHQVVQNYVDDNRDYGASNLHLHINVCVDGLRVQRLCPCGNQAPAGCSWCGRCCGGCAVHGGARRNAAPETPPAAPPAPAMDEPAGLWEPQEDCRRCGVLAARDCPHRMCGACCSGCRRHPARPAPAAGEVGSCRGCLRATAALDCPSVMCGACCPGCARHRSPHHMPSDVAGMFDLLAAMQHVMVGRCDCPACSSSRDAAPVGTSAPCGAASAGASAGVSGSTSSAFPRGEGALQRELEELAPLLFHCPLSMDVMDDPVVAQDGYTYERAMITQWQRRSDRSPMTNQPMGRALLPNNSLRSSIQEWALRAKQALTGTEDAA